MKMKPVMNKSLTYMYGGMAVYVTCAAMYAFCVLYYPPGYKILGGDPEKWGQFGDFLGGLLNPLISLVTLMFFSFTLRQNEFHREEQSKFEQKALDIEVCMTLVSFYTEQAHKAVEEAKVNSGDAQARYIETANIAFDKVRELGDIIDSEHCRLMKTYPRADQ